MKRKPVFAGTGITLAAVLAVALLLGPHRADGPDEASIGSPAAAQGPTEGLQVHGAWVIEVRNSDGTLEDRREFSNDLTFEGQQVLARVLTRAQGAVVSGWCVDAADVLWTCESDIHPEYVGVQRTLTVDYPYNGTDFTLRGSMVTEADGTITEVGTHLFIDDWALSYDFTLATSAGGDFLEVPLVAGQQIQIEVTISFS